MLNNNIIKRENRVLGETINTFNVPYIFPSDGYLFVKCDWTSDSFVNVDLNNNINGIGLKGNGNYNGYPRVTLYITKGMILNSYGGNNSFEVNFTPLVEK